MFCRQMCTAAVILAILRVPCRSGNEPTAEDGMFHVYQNNRAHGVSNYITRDFLLLAHSMILTEEIVAHEEKQDYPNLRALIADLATEAKSAASAKEKDADAVRANREFLAVLTGLLDGSNGDVADSVVVAELAQVRAASGIAKSGVLAQTIDYTQFRPRGHYTRTPELQRYFQAVRYAGAALFHVKESAATGIDAATADRLTQQAMLLSDWIHRRPAILAKFQKMQEQREWLFGPAEDLALSDLHAVAATHPSTIAVARITLLARARANGHQPLIWSSVIDPQKLEKGVSAGDALTGWRLLPGSVTPDGAAAQKLVYSSVGKFLGDAAQAPVSLTTVNGTPVKGFPLALEMMALLGSTEADKKLGASQDTRYEGYTQARAAAQGLILKPAGLVGEHLHLMKTLLASDKEGLESALGFWTLARHQSVLYAKQSYTGTGKGILPEDNRTTASLESSLTVYKELRDTAMHLQTRLGSANFAAFGKLLDQCIAISQAETAAQKLTAQQIAFLNGLDLDLARLIGRPDEPIAVDVHTDVNSGQALIEALRYPAEVTNGAERGARFRTAEFKRPLADRITDESWREMLAKETAK